MESLALDPSNENVVYAALGNGKYLSSGVYISVDQGASWQVTGLSGIDIYGNDNYR